MRQYLLAILSVLAALLAMLFSIDTAGYQYSSRSYRTYSFNPNPDTRSGDENVASSMLQMDNTDNSSFPMVETITNESFSPLIISNSPLSTPPAMLAMSAMTTLSPSQLPPLDAGMVNVTSNLEWGMRNEELEEELTKRQAGGYRVESLPFTNSSLQIVIPYDPELLPQGFTEDDIQTYVYDRQYQRWVAIPRDSVNAAELLVYSRFRPSEKGLSHTQNDLVNPQDALAQVQDMMSFASQGEGGDSPLDFINAVLKTPEMPETSAYTPTSIKELKAADPLEGLTLMQPPTANNSGTANLSYPIEIPAGRQGMQPNLALTYSSSGGNGWLGVGWDISIPSITVETRWGVPRYDQNKESEVYLYEGEQLVTKDGNGNFREMPHRTNQWTSRSTLGSEEQFFPRKNEAYDSIVRHGSGPDCYWWTVTHKNGVTDYYGKYASDNGVNNDCVLSDPVTNHIARWMLTESVDPYGNRVRYFYVIERCGSVDTFLTVNKGVQVYPDHIDYTGHGADNGAYSVRFNRKDGRKDVITNGRYGFREVTASTLCNLEILCLGRVIRKYYFVTENLRESGYKTRLTDMVRHEPPYEYETDCDSVMNPNNWRDNQGPTCKYTLEKQNMQRFNFDYYDYPSSNALFGPRDTITLTDDGIQSSFLGGSSATALGATSSKGWSAGGTVCVGFGADVWETKNSVGGNFSYSRSRSKGLLTLIDIDGDGNADKLYKRDGKVYYRRCISTGEYSFEYGPEISLPEVTDFLDVVGNTPSFGIQGHFGIFNVNGGLPVSVSDTKVYFSDVNGDGLPDLVTDKGVLFNNTGNDGNVSFSPWQSMVQPNPTNPSEQTFISTSSYAGCGGIIYDGEVEEDLLCLDYLFDTIPVLEDKVYQIIDSLNGLGMRVTDYNDSTVTYCKSDTAIWYCGNYSNEPDLDAVRVWVAPHDGNIRLFSTVALIEDTSESVKQSRRRDGVCFSVQHNTGVHTNGYELLSDIPTVLYRDTLFQNDHLAKDTTFFVHQNDVLFFRLQSGRSRLADRVQESETISYITGSDANEYNSINDFVLTGKGLFCAPKKGSVTITGTLHRRTNAHLDCFNLTILKNGNIAYLDSLTLSNNYVQVNKSFSVDSGDTVRIIILQKSANVDWGNVIFLPVLQFDGDPTDMSLIMSSPIEIHPHVFKFIIHNNTDHLRDSLRYWFGPLYKGWGCFTYNNNFPNSAGLPIDVSRLVIPAATTGDTTEFSRSKLSSTINEANYEIDTANTDAPTANFTPESLASDIDSLYNPLSDNTSWVPAYYNGEYGSYVGFGGTTEIAADMMGNTRHIIELQQDADENENDYDSQGNLVTEIPEYDDVVPVSVDGFPIKTIRKRSVGVTGSIGAGISEGANLSVSLSLGSNTVQSDFIDLNGDRYPDIFVKKSVQYTMPWGGLETTPKIIGSGDKCASQSLTYAFGFTIGGGYPDPYREAGVSPPNQKVAFRGASFSGSYVKGGDNTNLIFQDVNGDGLPDKIWLDEKKAALNMGYTFQSPEGWLVPDVRKGKNSSMSMSGGLSFSYNQYSLGGGVGNTGSESRNKSLFMDINGDGLPDYVEIMGSYLKIQYAYGNGEWSSISDNISGIYDISKSASSGMSSSIDFTVGFPVMTVKLTVGAQVSPLDKNFTRDECQLVDINGDGYPDLVTSQAESSMTVRYNTAGKTNLLRKVTNFTGNTIEMDYNMLPSSYEKPHREWNLENVVVTDPFFQQNGNVSHTRFTYEDPHYDRYERMDYGYRKVTAHQYDTDGGDTLYRYMEEEFNNRNFIKRGRKTRDCIYDASNNPYIEHLYGDTLYDYAGSVVSDSVCARSDLYVKKEVDITNWYEGQHSPQVTSMVEREYDHRRNVIKYTHYGDTTHTDEWFCAQIDYASGLPRNLVSLPSQIVVRNMAGDTLQWRIADYYSTGKFRQLVQYYCSSAGSQFDFTYDTCGNLSGVIMPPNQKGQRLEYSYTYDSLTRSCPVSVTNLSFNLSSTAEYDYRFGKPIRTIDVNGNEMQYLYDSLGRLVMVKAPYEIDSLSGDEWGTVNYSYFPHNYGMRDIFSTGQCPLPLSSALTEYIDTQQPNGPASRVMTMSDNFGRPVQSKRETMVNGDTVHVVTGKTVYDCFGRTLAQHAPVTEPALYSALSIYCDTMTSREYANEYDVLDRLTKQTLPYGHISSTEYGFATVDNNRTLMRTSVTDAMGSTVSVLSGTLGQELRRIAPLNTVTRFSYDALGRILSSTDPMNLVTTYSYDMQGRMVRRTHPDAGTDKYGYDPSGNLEWHVNAQGDTIRYWYDHNRLTEIQYPLHPENNVHYTYGTMADTVYNAAGKVILLEDGSGWQTFKYGKLGEVTENIRTFALPYDNQTYTFKMNFEYDSWNRIQSMTYPDGEVVHYQYNHGGDLFSIYGEYSRRIPITPSQDSTWTGPKYQPDDMGRDIPSGNQLYTDTVFTFHYIDSIRYDKYGMRTQIRYGNGTLAEYEYDSLRRLSGLQARTSSGYLMQNISYTYDNVGNITGIANVASQTSGMGGPYDAQYTYDNLYRLSSATGSWHPRGLRLPFSMSMLYSPNGQILSKRADYSIYENGTVTNRNLFNGYTYPAGRNTVTVVEDGLNSDRNVFTWDASGNMTSWRLRGTGASMVRNQDWTEDNRLRSVVDWDNYSYYMYDANGDRICKLVWQGNVHTINGISTVYYTPAGVTLYTSPYLVVTPQGYTKHYYAESERVASQVGKGRFAGVKVSLADSASTVSKLLVATQSVGMDPQTGGTPSTPYLAYLGSLTDRTDSVPENYFYHPDHLGSASWITDSAGRPVQHLQYLPWGESFVDQRSSTFDGARFTFSAKEKDAETGFSYFGSRYYNSDLSIWLSVDPMSDKYPSMSPYVYCANNPIKLVDPNGEEIYVGDNYYYNNGLLYYKGTNDVYTPEKGSFEEKALNSLNKLRGTKQGGELMSRFEGNTGKDALIVNAIYRQGDKNNQSGVDNKTIDATSGDFKSATIYWNPEGQRLRTTEGYQQNGTTDLGHEFSHIFDMADKNVSNNRIIDGAPEGEWRAVYRENMIRLELGSPYRVGYKLYHQNPSTGKVSPVFVKMLVGGSPYLPKCLRQ